MRRPLPVIEAVSSAPFDFLSCFRVSLCHSESYQRVYVEKSDLFVYVLEHLYLTSNISITAKHKLSCSFDRFTVFYCIYHITDYSI